MPFVVGRVPEDVLYSLLVNSGNVGFFGDSRVTGSALHGVSSFGGRSTCTGLSHELIV